MAGSNILSASSISLRGIIVWSSVTEVMETSCSYSYSINESLLFDSY